MPTRRSHSRNYSKQMLRRVQQNDSTLTCLAIGGNYGYNSTDQYDYSRLGAAVAKNNHLKHLIVISLHWTLIIIDSLMVWKIILPLIHWN